MSRFKAEGFTVKLFLQIEPPEDQIQKKPTALTKGVKP